MEWTIEFSKRALKDAKKLKAANLDQTVKELLEILRQDPYASPYEKLVGDLSGYYSRRINIKHRLVYRIDHENQRIQIVSVWSHYE